MTSLCPVLLNQARRLRYSARSGQAPFDLLSRIHSLEHKPLQDEITYKILKAIEDNPSHSQRQLSRNLGVSLGKVNYCLKALMEKGWIKANNFKNNPQKSDYLYLLTPAGVEAKAKVTVRFLKRKIAEYERIKQEIQELEREMS